ncbi:MAG: hypothetical protein IJ667_10100 [Synergistaceae bacterium]|nr:hypothetical protein [Synergistaceae bacterium]
MNNNKQDNSAPVVTEWREFIFNGEECDNWPIFAGVDKDGNIWLKLKNISEVVSMESCGTLDKDEFYELVRKLPLSQHKGVLISVPDVQNGQHYQYTTGITSSGLFKVVRELLKDSDQPEQAKKAARGIWNWLVHNVFPEMRELAAKQPEDLPSMIKQQTFTYADKYEIRVGIDKDDEIWLATRDIFNALNQDTDGAIYPALWRSVAVKLSSKQHKEIMLCKNDRLEYYRVGALNISGLYAVTKALQDNQAESVKAAADKLWNWVMSEVIFPMLRLKDKACGSGELELDEVPDDEEIEATKLIREPKHNNTVTLSEFVNVLNFNGLNIGLDMLQTYLIHCDWLDKNEQDAPTSFALNNGLFTHKAELTIKGQWYFLRLFATLKATAFDYVCDEIFSEITECCSEKILNADADIVAHFLNIIGIGQGAK